MKQGNPGPEMEWEVIYQNHIQEDGKLPQEIDQFIQKLCRPGEESLLAEAAWLHLKPVIDFWLHIGDVRPEVPYDWNPLNPQKSIELIGTGIFGVLAVQLLASITGNQGMYLCHSCGRPFSPKRKPQTGRRSFCNDPKCKRSGNALRQSEHRIRKRRQV